MSIEEIVKYTKNLTENDLVWKPLYPNNIKSNGIAGEYCFLWVRNREGKYSGRKYTILFQEKEDENGCTRRGEHEFFILFENMYNELDEPLEYPPPSEDSISNLFDFLEKYDINTYGTFVRAYTDADFARKRALKQFKMVFAYAMSYIVPEKEYPDEQL